MRSLPTHRFARLLLVGSIAMAASQRPTHALAALEKGAVNVEKVEFKGWKNNLKMTNGNAEVIVTLDVGPRIISYRLADGKNVFKEYPDQLGKTGEAEWVIRGGHRLWAAPEDTTRTYFADNGPVEYRDVGPGLVRFKPAPEAAYGLQKEIDLRLATSGSKVTVIHRIRNVGKQPTELAPWGLSVMAPGGIEIIPLPAKAPHPGASKNAKSAADFAPNQMLVLWPYTDFSDERLHLSAKYITLRQDPAKSPTKIGLAHRGGWVGYLNAGTLFVKRVEPPDDKAYPDRGCNYETFTNEDMLEMESLGPMIKLAPNEATELIEHWELFPGVKESKDDAQIDANVRPLIKP